MIALIAAVLLAAANPQLVAGKIVYDTHCIQCHGPNLQGTSNGPSLQHVGAAAVDFMLRTGRMPLEVPGTEALSGPPQLTPAQIKAVEAFALASGAQGGPPIPSPAPGNDLARGRKIFDDNCEACHGAQGIGATVGFGWVAPDLYPADATEVAEAVRFGPGVMPNFDNRQISDSDLNDLVTYVLTFRHPPDVGGYALAHVGPTAEGLIAWFFGIGSTCIVMVLVGETLRSRQQPDRDRPR